VKTTVKVIREVSFFIPHIKRHNFESAYESIKSAIKYQMGWNVTDRRIESLSYTSGKRKFTAKVGEFGMIEHRHEVAAIMEAALYLVVTRTKSGEPGPTILVDTKDVIEITNFKAKAEKPKPALAPAA